MKDQEEGVKFELKYILPDGASAQQAMAIEKIMDDALEQCAKVLGGRVRSRIP
jgi:hypothetical protein